MLQKILVFTVGLLVASISWAQGRYELSLGGELPLYLGGRFQMNFEGPYFIAAGLGYTPNFMADLTGSLVGGVGVTGQKTGELAADALSNGFYVEAQGGYRLHESGWYISGGISYLSAQGADTDRNTIEDATGDILSGVLQSDSMKIKGAITSLVAHAGRTWELGAWTLVGEVGVIKPLAASVTYEYNEWDPGNFRQDQVEDSVKPYLEDVFKQEFFIPTVSVWTSFSF